MKKSLMLVLVFIFSIYSVSACVEPTNGMVITEDMTFCPGEYNLPGTVSDNSAIIIGADNVVLDCNGASLIGSQNGRFGIYSYGRDHLTIKNCRIKDYYMGIFLASGVNSLNQNNIKNNIIFGYGAGYGIKVIRFVGGEISANHISNFGEVGIDLDLSENNFIYGNSVYGDSKGVSLDHTSSANTISGNVLCTSDLGLDCISTGYNFGEYNKLDSLNNDGGCAFIRYSSCNNAYSPFECSSVGGRCSSVVSPGEISIGSCTSNPKKKFPQIQDAAVGPRFSGEQSLFDKIQSFFRSLFVRQSKINIENVQSNSDGSEPNDCVIAPLAVSDFGNPGCLGSLNSEHHIDLCVPKLDEVYFYNGGSFGTFGSGIKLDVGLFCSVSDDGCSPIVNYNAVYSRECNSTSWDIIGEGENYPTYNIGEMLAKDVDVCTGSEDVSLSCFELNEVYHKFGTDINDSFFSTDLTWALDWAGSEGANAADGHSWHESGYSGDKLMCGYCGDGMEGPRESSNSNYIPCNDSNFVVNGDEKCYCPSDVIVYSEPGNGDCEPGEYDSGELNGCHTGALFPTSVCEYGVCEAGDCVALEIPTRMPSCGGTGWYNNDPCTNPDTQCYEDSCLGGAYCASGTCSGGTPVCCGDGVCNGLENCPEDAIGCTDRVCYESTCDSGCNHVPVPEGEEGFGCESPYQCDGDGDCEPISCDLIDCYDKSLRSDCESQLNNVCCKWQVPQYVPCGASQPYCVNEDDPDCTGIYNINSCQSTSGCTAQLMDGGFFGCLRTSNCGSCNHNVWLPGTTFSYTCSS